MDIVLDFHMLNFDHTQKEGYCPKKISTFIELMAFLLRACLDKRLTRDQAFLLFKEHALRHAVARPPHSLAIFNLDEVKNMLRFLQENFLRFYALYTSTLLTNLQLSLSHEEFFEVEAPEIH